MDSEMRQDAFFFSGRGGCRMILGTNTQGNGKVLVMFVCLLCSSRVYTESRSPSLLSFSSQQWNYILLMFSLAMAPIHRYPCTLSPSIDHRPVPPERYSASRPEMQTDNQAMATGKRARRRGRASSQGSIAHHRFPDQHGMPNACGNFEAECDRSTCRLINAARAGTWVDRNRHD
jgi:hypothetical protein